MTRERVSYEWAIEESDEDGDILDVDHADTLAEALERKATAERLAAESGIAKVSVALLRLTYDEIDGEQDRHYAYLRPDGTLPEIMETADDYQDGPPVPKRFHLEAAKLRPFAEAS